jgi:hypothetical protein
MSRAARGSRRSATPHEVHKANVNRLYPKLIEIVDRENIEDAGAALCVALTILAFREGFALEALLFMTRDTIKEGWLELRNSAAQQLNGEEDGKT